MSSYLSPRTRIDFLLLALGVVVNETMYTITADDANMMRCMPKQVVRKVVRRVVVATIRAYTYLHCTFVNERITITNRDAQSVFKKPS